MKKILLIAAVLMLVSSSAFAQGFDFGNGIGLAGFSYAGLDGAVSSTGASDVDLSILDVPKTTPITTSASLTGGLAGTFVTASLTSPNCTGAGSSAGYDSRGLPYLTGTGSVSGTIFSGEVDVDPGGRAADPSASVTINGGLVGIGSTISNAAAATQTVGALSTATCDYGTGGFAGFHAELNDITVPLQP
jgi:hypothetical protein